MKRKFIRDQTAEGYIDVAITMLIIFVFMASLLALYPIFTAQQTLNQSAQYTARTIELYGKADDETLESMTADGDFLVPDRMEVEAEWQDAAAKTIQLKTPFTVTMTKVVPIIILCPALSEPVVINVQITATARGISEVYWK